MFDRGRFLRRTGLLTLAGGAIVLARPGSAIAGTVTAENVKEPPYNAQGDGVTDDRASIQAALDAVPSSGGAVYFPPGDYTVSGPLVPKSRTLIIGNHTPRWEGSDNPASASKIRVRSNFSGGGLVVPASNTVAVTLRDVALVGNAIGTGLHGLRMPDSTDAVGELSWSLENVTIAGFTGCGIYGRMHVGNLTNCHFHNNRVYGIGGYAGNHWNDVHLQGCYFYFNRASNVYFSGARLSEMIEFVNCRFERAGGNPGDPFNPLDKKAPGVHLSSCRFFRFVNCSTDANSGNGIEIVHDADTPLNKPDYLQFANCHFNRDGTGDTISLDNFAGLKAKGQSPADQRINHVKCVNCVVTHGPADDGGQGSIHGPRYGVWYENTNHFQWIAGDLSPSGQASNNHYYEGTGGNYRPVIYDLLRGLITLPVDAPNASMPIPTGSAYFDTASNRLYVRNGGVWRSVQLT